MKRYLLYIFLFAILPMTAMADSWTGTGFALKDGYVVTNKHVVDGARTLLVCGSKNDVPFEYVATVVATDQQNDIAIIKISDSKFKGFGEIPYKVRTDLAEVGEDCFVLGYPMTDVMGTEVKLTTGVISSRSGYLGDLSTYQISAPIQPGNSGGPLFDGNGNVIGITCAGIRSADNVGYAIKTSFLKNLTESSMSRNPLPTTNKVTSMKLSEKVKTLKKFVFIIFASDIEYYTPQTQTSTQPVVELATEFEYEITSGNTASIKKYIGRSSSVKIPQNATINGKSYKITEIGDWAFGWDSRLTSIVIPSSVTEIGDGAFGWCTGLTSLTIPSSVTKIGTDAFKGCTGLTSIVIPDSVTKIGTDAFKGCTGLTSIKIPNSVTEIGDGAFKDCSKLQYIFNCSPLSLTKGSDNYGKIAKYAKVIAPCGTKIVNDCLMKDDSVLIEYYGTGSTCSIPPKTRIIAQKAFYNATFTSVKIPDGTTTIGDYAFWRCSELTSIKIPNSVTKIGDWAFSDIGEQATIVFEGKVENISPNAFKETTIIVQVPKEYAKEQVKILKKAGAKIKKVIKY